MAFTNEEIARVAHEANRALQIIGYDIALSPPWDAAPEWQKAPAVEGVGRALDGETPESLHDSWCQHKRADGWVYGPVKSLEALTHPCLVPYEDLPPEQKVKDAVFAAIVRAMSNIC